MASLIRSEFLTSDKIPDLYSSSCLYQALRKLQYLWLCLSMYVHAKTRGDVTSEIGRCMTKDTLTCFAANWPISFSTMSEPLHARRTARAHRDHTRLRCRRKSMSMFCPGQPRGAARGSAAASGWVSTGLWNQNSPGPELSPTSCSAIMGHLAQIYFPELFCTLTCPDFWA